MMPKLKSILWWTPNLLLFAVVCQVMPLGKEDSFVIRFIQCLAWATAFSFALMAYTSHIDDLIERCARHYEVPYILELACDGGMIIVFAASGYYITAWVWFMRMIALRKIYSRAHEHFERLFMEKVEEANRMARTMKESQ